MLGASPAGWESEDGGYGSLNAASSLDTTCSRTPRQSSEIHSKFPTILSYICASGLFGQVLLCGGVRPLGGASVDGFLQAVGLLFGAAGGAGVHVRARHCVDGAAGGWRRRLRLGRRL